MKILVTGAAGFFGSNLCEHFLKNGHEVVGIDNFNDYYNPKIKEYNIQEFRHKPNFELYRDDILDHSAMDQIFEKEGPFHTIVHLAAWAGVTASMEQPEVYVRNNVEGTVNMAELAVKHKVKNFIYASTSSVYGTNPVPFKEDMCIIDPQSPYPATKRAAELLLNTYSINYGLPVTVFRIFNPVGKRLRPDLALPKLIRSAEFGDEFKVYWPKSEWAKTKRDYCYIGHMFEAIDKVIEKPFDFEIINLGNSDPTGLGSLFKAVEKVVGKKLNLKVEPKRMGEMIITYADVSKAKKLLGYDPKTSLEEGIKIFYDWYMQQENWYKKGKI
jgi:UDP-glucuronate 4-epimerase